MTLLYTPPKLDLPSTKFRGFFNLNRGFLIKWFKHYENAHTNQFIQALLMEKNGRELYGCWFLLLELLCKEFKKDSEHYIISVDQLARTFHVKYTKKAERLLQDLCKFASTFEQDLLNVERKSEKFYKIQTPIILELMGKDFKRTRARSGKTTAKNKKKEERIRIKNNKKVFVTSEKLNELLPPIDDYAQHVALRLTEKNIQSLSEKYSPDCVSRNIHAIADYVAQSGKKYKDFDAALRSFLKRDDSATELSPAVKKLFEKTTTTSLGAFENYGAPRD